jgi:hypothetical protein
MRNAVRTVVACLWPARDEQDLTARRQALLAIGVAPDRVDIDPGMNGTKRQPILSGIARRGSVSDGDPQLRRPEPASPDAVAVSLGR